MSATNLLLQHHAHVWVSDAFTLHQEVTQQLQELFCKSHGCGTCVPCMQIRENQHPFVNSINPEGSYTLDDIDDILDQVKFKLDSNERRFFIFYRAQELTPACSNRLLKTIEEPHKGYYFVFLATRTDTMLPTILSRCFFKEFTQQTTEWPYQEIMQPFIDQNFSQPSQFARLVDKLDIKEQESKEIIDELIAHFYKKLEALHQQLGSIKLDHSSKDIPTMHTYMDYLVILKNQLPQLPLQGSSKIFWKNMYLTFDLASKR